MAELLMTPALVDRAGWLRVGAARYLVQQARKTSESHESDARPTQSSRSHAELTLAISAATKRDAGARAEACFAHRYARTKDGRTVR
jgi:hypothetical protein